MHISRIVLWTAAGVFIVAVGWAVWLLKSHGFSARSEPTANRSLPGTPRTATCHGAGSPRSSESISFEATQHC